MEKLKTYSFREKCGDCFYNGNCPITLKECAFVKNKKKPY